MRIVEGRQGKTRYPTRNTGRTKKTCTAITEIVHANKKLHSSPSNIAVTCSNRSYQHDSCDEEEVSCQTYVFMFSPSYNANFVKT